MKITDFLKFADEIKALQNIKNASANIHAITILAFLRLMFNEGKPDTLTSKQVDFIFQNANLIGWSFDWTENDVAMIKFLVPTPPSQSRYPYGKMFVTSWDELFSTLEKYLADTTDNTANTEIADVAEIEKP